MRRGFGGSVAVPAWARFMKAATRGATGRTGMTYQPTSRRSSICRASGARAGAGCLHQATEAASYGVGLWPVDLVAPLPPRQPPTFQDYYPRGFVADELCPLHNPAPNAITSGTTAGSGAMAVAAESSPVGTSGRAPERPQDVVIERRLRPDGSVGIVLRGGGR